MNIANHDVTLADIAKRCGISPRYLCYLLKSDQITFADLLWTERLSQVSSWLRNPQMDGRLISELAYKVGFKTASHFSRMFRKRYKMTPKEYRERRETYLLSNSMSSLGVSEMSVH